MLNNKILISVIIPYFKKKKFVFKTINSVLNQSYKNLEVIIIYDDKDLSDLKFIKSFSKKDKRIKIYLNKKNLGASKSRNIGVKKSRGYYIAFIDSDDLWKKNKLKEQLNFMRKNQYFISHSNYEIIDKNDQVKGLMKIKKKLEYNNLLYACDIGLSTVMIHKKLKKMIKFPNIKTKEDFILWLKISKKHHIFGIQKNLVSWRKTNSSLLYTFQKIKDAFELYSKYEKFNIIKSLFFVLILSMNFITKILLQKFYYKNFINNVSNEN